jgi:hypothetical protein
LAPDTEGVEPQAWAPAPALVGWEHETPVARISHRFTYKPGVLVDVTGSHNLELRLLSYVLIDALPDKALPELLEAVGFLWEHHLPLPAGPTLPEPSVKRTSVKLGRRYDRPTFPISEG